jgi:hypothetical protein
VATFRDDTKAREMKERITAALFKINPRLERFVFDYSKIADSPKISEEQARLRFSHIEMNPPEGELVILATIFDGSCRLFDSLLVRGRES